jgi:hypothetical protein
MSLVAATALAVIGVTAVAQSAAAAPPTGYVPMSALINGDSITLDDGITDGSGNRSAWSSTRRSGPATR